MKNINPGNISNEMSDALTEFRISAQKIAELWSDKENFSAMHSAETMNCYPFSESFGDVSFGIDAWFNAIRDYNTPLQKNIRFVKSHRKEIIDCINDVREVGQNLLDHGCPITYAEIYKTEDDKIFWLLYFNKGFYALTKDGTFSMPEITRDCTRIWHQVLEDLQSCPKLSYDNMREINICIEYMTMDAEDEEEEKNRKA